MQILSLKNIKKNKKELNFKIEGKALARPVRTAGDEVSPVIREEQNQNDLRVTEQSADVFGREEIEYLNLLVAQADGEKGATRINRQAHWEAGARRAGSCRRGRCGGRSCDRSTQMGDANQTHATQVSDPTQTRSS